MGSTYLRDSKKGIKIFLISVGLIDSFYLLLTSYQDYVSEICPLSGCSFLIYNGINIPALFGFIWFLFYGFAGKFLFFWQLLGIFGILSLGSIALFTGYFCIYCIIAYGIGLCLIALDRFLTNP
jgi:hypothetical protein